MESVLQMCETYNSNYPDHFKEFLKNCLEKFSNRFQANDYLFAAVYFIILECGFCPKSFSEDFPDFVPTDSFDIRKLRFIKSYSHGHFKFVQSQVAEHLVYGIKLVLGNYSMECELQGVPSVENDTYLIINFVLKPLGIVKSLCLCTDNYITGNDSSSKDNVTLTNLFELSLLTKDKLSNNIKSTIMLSEGHGCCPHLLRLPEVIQKRIIYFLSENSTDVQYLASTCTYFHDIISNDFELWKSLCFSEFDGKSLKEALKIMLKTSQNDQHNVFKQVFINLKREQTRKFYKFW